MTVGIWDLQGTDNQQQIVAAAVRRILFPWDRLKAGLAAQTGKTAIPVRWRDLNTQAAARQLASGGDGHIADPDLGNGHAVVREDADGRRFVAGMAWSNGMIEIDVRCEQNPGLAQEVFSAECAHAVDFFLPMTDSMHGRLLALWHPGGADPHTWWEVQSYTGEYANLGGEAWMGLFTFAYSDMVPEQTMFVHKATPGMAAEARRIIGVTGGQPPTPTAGQVVSLTGYRTAHRPTHYTARWTASTKTAGRVVIWDTLAAAQKQGLTACKVCKPT